MERFESKEPLFVWEDWTNLPADCGILYSWVWNSPITEELIREQIGEMQENGVRGFYIIPEPKEFRPTSMKTRMEPPYLSPEFLQLVRYAAEYGNERGMCVWLYDEGGWPSGSANGEVTARYPDSRDTHLARRVVSLRAGETLPCHDGDISAFIDENGGLSRVPLSFRADRDCTAVIYYPETRKTAYPYLLDAEAVQAFLDTTHERYASVFGDRLSSLIRAVFTDEAVLHTPFYLRDPSAFERESGYVLADWIPALFGEYRGEEGCAFRAAYNAYCTKQFVLTYTGALHEWCIRHGLSFTGHMSGDHALATWMQQGGEALMHLRRMDIPGVDVIVRQIFPGAEPAGLLSGEGENTFFPRLASSAAHQTGKTLCVSESYAVYGDGLTPDEMRWIAGYQFVRGINVMNVMSVTSGRDGFLSAQCRPHFQPELPDYPYVKTVNDAVSRMMLLCGRGKPDTAEALYRPMRDVWAGNPAVTSTSEAEASYLALGRRLEAGQHDFDLIDEEFLCTAVPENGALRMGDAAYRTVYLPKTRWISDEAVGNLRTFLACGGTVYAETPIPGLPDARILPGDGELPGAPVSCSSRHIRVRRRTGNGERLYILFCETQKLGEKEDFTVIFRENSPGYLLNPDDGSVFSWNGNTLALSLCAGETRMVLFSENRIPAESLPVPGDFTPVGTVTEFTVTPISRTVFDGSGFTVSPCTADETPGADFSGTAEYRAVFAWKAGEPLRIGFPRILHTARVTVNGREIASFAFPPFEADIPGELLQSENTLSVYVSNTAADTIAAFDTAKLDPQLVGPYDRNRTSVYERDSLGIGIPEGCILYARGKPGAV